MYSIIRTNTIDHVQKRTGKTINLTKFWEALEEGRFGFTPLLLVIATTLGGIAAACALGKSMIMLTAVVCSTGLVEALLIAIAPMKKVFWILVVAVIIDLLVFIF